MQNNLNSGCLAADFSHIYIEECCYDNPYVKKILNHFPDAVKIPIVHYKDVFNRSRQAPFLQAKQLILAKNSGNLIFPGAKVCQSFGNEHFYYTSNVLNCIYNCEYCYLKGMYDCSYLVCFVNLEDTFHSLEKLLEKFPVYLCISYDSDLLALEPIFGFLKEWTEFAKDHPDLTLEVRTKSANRKALSNLPVLKNVIYAWTLSPQTVITAYEHKTPSLADRLIALTFAMQAGHPVRLCFDPMIFIPDWENDYKTLITHVFSHIKTTCPDSMVQMKDASIGVFRISKEYLKQMRTHYPSYSCIRYPFEAEDGYYTYEKNLRVGMITTLKTTLLHYLKEDQIFIWEQGKESECKLQL